MAVTRPDLAALEGPWVQIPLPLTIQKEILMETEKTKTNESSYLILQDANSIFASHFYRVLTKKGKETLKALEEQYPPGTLEHNRFVEGIWCDDDEGF